MFSIYFIQISQMKRCKMSACVFLMRQVFQCHASLIWACHGDCETNDSLLKWLRTQCRFWWQPHAPSRLHQSLCWVTDDNRRCKQDLVLAPPYSLLPRPPPSWTWYANESQLQRRFQQVTWCGSNIFWEFLSQFPLLQYRPNVARRVKTEATEEEKKQAYQLRTETSTFCLV